MHALLIHVAAARLDVVLSAEPHQALVEDVHRQMAHGSHEDIHPHVELLARDEQWVAYVLLDHSLVGFLGDLHRCAGDDDALALTPSIWLEDEGLAVLCDRGGGVRRRGRPRGMQMSMQTREGDEHANEHANEGGGCKRRGLGVMSRENVGKTSPLSPAPSSLEVLAPTP